MLTALRHSKHPEDTNRYGRAVAVNSGLEKVHTSDVGTGKPPGVVVYVVTGSKTNVPFRLAQSVPLAEQPDCVWLAYPLTSTFQRHNMGWPLTPSNAKLHTVHWHSFGK